MESKIKQSGQGIKSFLTKLQAQLADAMCRAVESQLEADVTACWQRTALRTTSLLARVNRMLRRLFRPKGAFHSLTGLQATTSRVLSPLRLI